MVRAMTSVHPDLTFNEVRALNFIGRHPGATQKNWCATAAPTRPRWRACWACCRTRAGWSASRTPRTGASGLTLSAEGQALYQALQAAARQTLSAQVLAGCDDATQAQLLPCWRGCGATWMRCRPWRLARTAATARAGPPGRGPSRRFRRFFKGFLPKALVQYALAAIK